jgi:hypothetical protein
LDDVTHPRTWKKETIVRSASRGSARIVLLVLIQHADWIGRVAMSFPDLARSGSLSERQAKRAVTMLVDLGEIEVVRRGKGRASNAYRVLWIAPRSSDIICHYYGNGKSP